MGRHDAISGFIGDRLANKAWLAITDSYRLCNGVLAKGQQRIATVKDDVPSWEDPRAGVEFEKLVSALPTEHFGAPGIVDIVPTVENVMEQLRSIDNAVCYMAEFDRSVIVICRPVAPGMPEEAIVFPSREIADAQKEDGFDITRWLEEHR